MPVKTSEENGTKSSGQKWKSYTEAWTETAFLWPLKSVLPYWLAVRQAVVRSPPFTARCRCLPRFTYFEIFVTIVLVAASIAGSVMIFQKMAITDDNVEKTGSFATFATVVAFSLALRNSVWTLVLGIPFERQLWWHKCSAFAVYAISAIHGWYGYVEEGREIDGDGLSGVVMFGAMVLLMVTSFWPLRACLFEFFYVAHIFFVIVSIIAGLIHGAGPIALIIWLIDLTIRYIWYTLFSNRVNATAMRLPADVVRVTFKRPDMMHYNAGQYVFVLIPSLSWTQWHPFSVSSAPHQKEITLHIRALGNWTRKLHDSLKDDGEEHPLSVYIDGPYGSPEIDVDGPKYKLFLLISGGIGITPMQSVTSKLVYEHDELGRDVKKIWFVWSCSDSKMIDATFESNRNPLGVSNKVTPMSKDASGSESIAKERTSKTSNKSSKDKRRDKSPSKKGRLLRTFQPDTLPRHSIDAELSRAKKAWQDPNKRSVFSTDGGPADILHTEFYLTRARADTAGHAAKADLDDDLASYVQFGRPDLEAIFTTMRNYAIHVKETRVAVMVCGPQPLVDDVQKLSCTMDRDGVAFDCHAELFVF